MPTGNSLHALLRACAYALVALNIAGRDLVRQGIARKGHYGAFLLSEPDVQLAVNRTLVTCPLGFTGFGLRVFRLVG